MALVNLRDVKVYSTFSKGFRVVEESKGRDGKDYSTRWTIWLEGTNLHDGDIVSLSGFLSAKVNEWTDKEGQTRHSVELALNSPRISTGEGSTGAPAAQQAESTPMVNEPWNAPQIASQDIPF